jgi:exodeoxyribonuclease-3
MPTIVSWNVNGVRAVAQKGFIEWVDQAAPDILCLQETKAHEGDVAEHIRRPNGYGSVWQSAKKRGYSSVAVYFKPAWEPVSVRLLGIDAFDDEGRALVAEYKNFTLINAYFPNSQPERKRLQYKLDFCNAMLANCNALRATGKNIVLCGDYNIAHRPIDLARPKENENNAGYYIEEREFMDKFTDAGYMDTFRYFHKQPGHYSWWSYRAGARASNVGWRIDYHCVNNEFIGRVKNAAIWPEILGSDHCPVVITLKK